MDCQDYITELVERKKGQHLQREDRGAIQQLKNAGYTNRAIARAIGCSPTTVGNELKRGTPPRKSSKGRKPGYSARRGEAAYKANRKRSRKPHRICHCTRFIRWIMEQVKEHKWSLDACVGYARLHRLFSADEMVCTRTLYNEVWAGSLDLSVTELLKAMKRKQHKDSKPREHRKSFGTDISQRPEIAALRIEEGHWEGDTFSQVFKTITVDNGSEFSAFSQVENWGCAVYFAHPYTSWERPQNERHNGLFRTFVPKGVSIEAFSAEYILAAADELNGRPRKKLGYRTPEELFDEFLDSVYAASGCGSIAQDGSQRLPS